MRTPLQAMLWELWRTSRREIATRLLFACAAVIWLSGFADKNFVSAELYVMRAAVLLMLFSSSVFSHTWLKALDNRTTGFTLRLGFTRPVSTRQLVLVPMLYCAAVSLVCFAVPACLFRSLSGMSLPLLAGSAAVVCLVLCFMAATWVPTSRWGQWIAVISVGLSLLILFLVHHAYRDDPDPWVLALGKSEYFAFAWYFYAGCVVLSVFAIALTISSVERQRHGGGWFERSPTAWASSRGAATNKALASAANISSRRPFRSLLLAQCWYEARRVGGHVLAFALLAPLLPLFFVCLGPLLYEQSMPWDGAPYVWLAALICCPAVYQLVGADGALGLTHKQGATQLSAFDATRAITNDHSIAIKLVVIAAYSLIGWLSMALMALLHTALAGTWHTWARIGAAISGAVGEVAVAWWLAAACSMVLFYISSTSMFVAFGLWLPKYPMRFMSGIAVYSLHAVVLVWDATNDWRLWPMWFAYAYVMALLIVALSGYILRRAYRAGYLLKPLFVVSCSLWVGYVGAAIASYLRIAPAIATQFVVPLPLLALISSLLLVPLVSTAIAPLALASYRHA